MRRLRNVGLGLIAAVMAVAGPLSAYTSAAHDYDFFSRNNIVIYNPDDTTCSISTSGGVVNSLSGSDNRQKIWNYLTARGLSPEQAAGVMGNLQSESAGTWNPVVNEYSQPFGRGGFGIAQWTDSTVGAGRRTALVNYLNSSIPDVMATYYTTDYSKSTSATNQSTGYVPKNASTGQLMAQDANDKLLLGELNRLYDEATTRTVGPLALAKNLGSKGQTEWQAIQQAKSVEDAANVWLYSYEVPLAVINASKDPTAAAALSTARINNSNAILALYNQGASGQACSGITSNNSSNGTKQELAKQIINNPNISYWQVTEGLRQKQIFQDIASGKSNGNDYPCGVNIQIMQMILAVAKNNKMTINDMNRACLNNIPASSSTRSPHYAGNGSAIDFGPINGMQPFSPAGARLLMSIIAPYLPPVSRVGENQCPGIGTIPGTPKGVGRFADACTHLHVDIPASTDPNLKCKANLQPGVCNNPV